MNKIILILIIIIPLILQQAEADEVKQGDKIVLRLWDIPSKNDRSVTGRARRTIYERFVETHPHIKTIPVSGIQIEGSAKEAFAFMAMAGGTAPDVFVSELNFRSIKSWIEQGFLYPLDEYIRKEDYLLSRIHPKALPVISKDGHIYGLPYRYHVKGLYYRRDLFKEVGIDPDKAPGDWQELYEYAQRLTLPEKGQYGLGFAGGWLGSWHLMDFIWQAGGEMVRQDNETKWRAVFNEEPGVVALNFYKKLAHEKWEKGGKEYRGVIGSSYSTFMEDFISAKIAMIFYYGNDDLIGTPDFDPAEIGFAPLPAGPTGIKANELNAISYGINSTIKDKKIRDSAWEYIKFNLSDESARIRTKIFVESGYAKFTNPIDLKKFGYERYLDEVPQGWLQANKDLFKTGQPEPYAPNYKSIQTVELTEITDRVLTYPDADPKKLLDASAKKCNEIHLGFRNPEEVNKKRNLGRILFPLVAGIVLFFFVKIIRLLSSGDETRQLSTRVPVARARFKRDLYAWMFMAPALLSVAIWAYYPLIKGSTMAFYDYRILGGSKFIGLDNFIEAFSQPIFWKAMVTTFYYVGLSLGFGFFIPIILALMLTEIPKGTIVYRTIYYLPAVTTGLVVIFIWKWFYEPSSQGLLNTVLGFFGAAPQGWLRDPNMAMLCVILPGIWAGAGPGSLIYQAALKSVPEEMYEAADLDGAGSLQKIWHVTLPTLKPLIIINFVGAFIGAFHAMENIFVMTGGGPMNATYTIGLDIFFNAFLYLKFGYATAVAWILGAILIGFTMYQLKMLKEVRFTTKG